MATNWEIFFDAHASIYDENTFTRNTLREVDFLLDVLELPAGGTVLDVGCGTGRHTVELARRGYAVTGVDLSAAMLDKAAATAATAGVKVNLLRADATRFSLPDTYDAAICLCEGAMGLLSLQDDPTEQPLAILRNISRCLKPQGRVVITALNASAMIRRCRNEDVAAGRFDPATLVESSEYPPREGLPPLPVRERAFMPSEFRLLLRLAGLDTLHLWGGTAGNWGRRPLDLDEMEFMAVACKAGDPPP